MFIKTCIVNNYDYTNQYISYLKVVEHLNILNSHPIVYYNQLIVGRPIMDKISKMAL